LDPVFDVLLSQIESTDSLIEQLLPKHIHEVKPQGFELKIAIFVLAASFNFFKIANKVIFLSRL
jgi:hypothetical protein